VSIRKPHAEQAHLGNVNDGILFHDILDGANKGLVGQKLGADFLAHIVLRKGAIISGSHWIARTRDPCIDKQANTNRETHKHTESTTIRRTSR
jgi:hypothetical protein